MVRFLAGKITEHGLSLLIVSLVLLVAQAASADAPAPPPPPPLAATLISLDHQHFPFIYLSVAVERNGQGISTLTKSNFQVTENGVLQTDYFDVIPPQAGGGVRLVDIVFLMDNSGSMSGEQNAVRDNVIEFVNDLAASDVDYALGLCRFGAFQDGGSPIIEDNGTLTTDPEYFKNTLWNRNVVNGGHEPGWDALYEAANGFAFRPGSQKVFILITDECVTHPGDTNYGDYSYDDALNALNDRSITAFALIDLAYTNSIEDYGTIAEATNGQYFDIYSPFDDILDFISSQVANTYRITYRSSNPAFDGTERHVVVTVIYQGDQAMCDGTYTPGSAPRIQRTQDTLALHNQPWAAGTQFTIKAEIADDVTPFVQSATLYYRKTGDPTYTPTPMAHSSDIWTGTILSAEVKTPGVDYYISATDGQSTVTDPSMNPMTQPYQLAILPNVAPQITHTPPTNVPINTAVTITAQILDTTNALAFATLWYRKVGQLIYQNNDGMTNTGGNNYWDSIPGSYVTAAGVEYYLFAEDDLGVGSYHGTPDNPHQIAVSTNQPPNTKIETTEIDSAEGTAKFTWSGSDDKTAAKDLVYSYRLAEDSSYSEWSTWSASTTKTYTGLSPANYRFQVRAKDGEDAIDPSPASREFTIREMLQGTISGRVTDASIPGPSNGIAEATLLLEPDPLTYCPVTLDQGYFSFSIPAGTYNVTASASGYSTLTKSVTVTAGETVEVDFALTEQERVPVIIIPGIMGSHLCRTGLGDYDYLWDPDDYAQIASGAVTSDLRDPDVKLFAYLVGSCYDALIGALQEEGYTFPFYLLYPFTDFRAQGYRNHVVGPLRDVSPNDNLFVFPYDWRQDIQAIAADLAKAVDWVLDVTGSTAVDIVAHSMGGLIARYFTNERPWPEEDGLLRNEVRKLVFFGVPSHGSPAIYVALKAGPLDVVGPLEGDRSVTVNIGWLANNFPSSFELLPSDEWWSICAENGLKYLFNDQFYTILGSNEKEGPLTSRADTYSNNPDSKLTAQNSEEYVQTAHAFHEEMGAELVFDGEFYNFVGIGVFTPYQLEKTRHFDLNMYEWRVHCSDGDRRVPRFSADRVEVIAGTPKQCIVYVEDASHADELIQGATSLSALTTILASPYSAGLISEVQGHVAPSDSGEPTYASVTFDCPVAIEVLNQSGERIAWYDPDN